MLEEPELIATQSSPVVEKKIYHLYNFFMKKKKPANQYQNALERQVFIYVIKLPVAMYESRMLTWVEADISIPSVLGLVPGAVI